jgi:hypothetical protein
MTRHLSRFGALVLAGAVAVSLGTPTVASAQRTQTSGANDGGRSGGGDSGGRAAAVPRGDSGSRGGDSGGGRTSAPAPAPAPAPSPTSARSSAESSSDGGGQARAVPRRGREDRPVVGNAIPRSQVPPYDGNIIVGGGYPYYSYYPYYPWYYPGYYPWGYGGIGFGFSWYSPGIYGSWYGPPYYGGGGYAHYDGAVRIKIKPSRAEVLVDGYYVGVVDEFDNPFQQLQLESGPHRIEVRADGYEPLSFEVRVLPGKTITYKAELKKNP